MGKYPYGCFTPSETNMLRCQVLARRESARGFGQTEVVAGVKFEAVCSRSLEK